MPIIIQTNKEGSDDVTFQGVDRLMIPTLMIHKALYKLCYVYQITYEEALSIWDSNSKKKILLWSDKRITQDLREGRHFVDADLSIKPTPSQAQS